MPSTAIDPSRSRSRRPGPDLGATGGCNRGDPRVVDGRLEPVGSPSSGSHSIVPAVLSVQKLCASRPATDSPVALQNLGHLGYEFSGR
jgi:hypothetical protein